MSESGVLYSIGAANILATRRNLIPLYAAPPPLEAQELTDVQILTIAAKCFCYEDQDGEEATLSFARALLEARP